MNLDYPGEKYLVTGELVDRNNQPIPFSAILEFEITIIDERGFGLFYNKALNHVYQGLSTNSYVLEIPETDTDKLYPGEITVRFKYIYPSSDFIKSFPQNSGNAVDTYEQKLTDIEKLTLTYNL